MKLIRDLLLNKYSAKIEKHIAEKRPVSLKSQLESGKCVDIINAGGRRTIKVHGEFTRGDLENLGFMKREQERRGGKVVRERWVYTGPEGSCINRKRYSSTYVPGGKSKRTTTDKRLTPGQATEWEDVDYS